MAIYTEGPLISLKLLEGKVQYLKFRYEGIKCLWNYLLSSDTVKTIGRLPSCEPSGEHQRKLATDGLNRLISLLIGNLKS